MVYRTAKQLKRLSDKQFFEDIKKYIKSSHSFYESRAPELKVLAKRLHEEYSLKDFYKVFNKFWVSGSAKQSSLAIYTLQLYKDDFDLNTWSFIKQKIKDVKSWDKLDSISINIIGEILLKNAKIEREIINLSNSKNIWLKRMSIISTIPQIRDGNFQIAMKIIEAHLYDKGDPIQKAIGSILREIGDKKPELLKRIIIKNMNMPLETFFSATENRRDLRGLRDINSNNKFERLMHKVKMNYF